MTAHAHFARTHPLTSSTQDPSQALAVWNASLNRFSWISANGLELLGKPTAELSATLHQNTLRKLNSIASATKAIKAARIILRLRGAVQVACVAEPWRLTDGDLGVIVYADKGGDRVDTQKISLSRQDDTAGERSATRSPSSQQAFTPGQLTAEEWKSFKSIGRMVRKLCREKAGMKADSKPQDAARRKTSPAKTEPSAIADLLPIFDVFMVLDARWQIIKGKGALSRLGWQSRLLRGQDASQLFDPREAASVAKCMQAVEANKKSVRKTALLANHSNSDRVSCRVLFGPWTIDPTEYFIGLICLNASKPFASSKGPNAAEPRIFGMAA